KKGPSIRVKMTVRFTNYKKFSGRIRLTDEGEVVLDEEGKATEKKTSPAPVILAVAAVLCVSVVALTTRPFPEVSPEEVIKRAAANEMMLKAAERDFYYRQDILVQTFGEANSVRAQLRRVSEMTYDIVGNRSEKIIEYPPSPLAAMIGVLQPDFKSLLGVDQFFLMADLISSYS